MGGTAIVGMLVPGESAQPVRIVCVGLIVLAVVGLQLTGNSST